MKGFLKRENPPPKKKICTILLLSIRLIIARSKQEEKKKEKLPALPTISIVSVIICTIIHVLVFPPPLTCFPSSLRCYGWSMSYTIAKPFLTLSIPICHLSVFSLPLSSLVLFFHFDSFITDCFIIY